MNTSRPELGPLKPGDSVFVILSSNASHGRTFAQRSFPGTVTKAACVWVEIETAPPGYSRHWRMRRDTQDQGSQYLGNNARFATPEQHAYDLAEHEAREYLREQRITVGFTSPWDGRLAELAARIRAA